MSRFSFDNIQNALDITISSVSLTPPQNQGQPGLPGQEWQPVQAWASCKVLFMHGIIGNTGKEGILKFIFSTGIEDSLGNISEDPGIIIVTYDAVKKNDDIDWELHP